MAKIATIAAIATTTTIPVVAAVAAICNNTNNFSNSSYIRKKKRKGEPSRLCGHRTVILYHEDSGSGDRFHLCAIYLQLREISVILKRCI